MSINNIFTIVGAVIIVMVIIASFQKPPAPRRGQPPRKKKVGAMVFTALMGAFIIAWSLLYTPGKGTLPACGLITTADTEEGFGWKVADTIGSKSPGGDATYCTYKLDAGTQQKTLDMFVGECKNDLMSKVKREPGAFDVSELGDEAVSSAGTLMARKGLNCYSLGFEEGDLDPHDTLEKRKAVLRKVMTRPIPVN